MKPQYQTRYELLHESYQKWLTGFTRHAVSWGVCHCSGTLNLAT